VTIAESLETKVGCDQLNARREPGGAEKLRVIHVSARLALPRTPVKCLDQPSRITGLYEFVYRRMIFKVAQHKLFVGTFQWLNNAREVFRFDCFECRQEFSNQFDLSSMQASVYPRLHFA
jgi:hypothetical protein